MHFSNLFPTECTQIGTKEPSSSNVHGRGMKRTHGPDIVLANTCSKRRKGFL